MGKVKVDNAVSDIKAIFDHTTDDALWIVEDCIKNYDFEDVWAAYQDAYLSMTGIYDEYLDATDWERIQDILRVSSFAWTLSEDSEQLDSNNN
jgi:hypothetical protein